MKRSSISKIIAGITAALLLFPGCTTDERPSSVEPPDSGIPSVKQVRKIRRQPLRGTIQTSASLPAGIAWKPATNVTVSSLFCDNAVLQQGKPVPVWGTGTDGKTVTVRFHDQVKETTVENGKWRVNLDPMTACAVNQPLFVTQDDEAITVHNVLVGEVWLVSGQSNITVQFFSLTMMDQQKERAKGERDGLRQFWVPQNAAEEPLTEISEPAWKICNDENISTYSAVGYYFASKLYEELGVPVGILTSAVGGTVLEQWLDSKLVVKEGVKNPYVHIGRNSLYNGMIAPLMPFAIKGIVWYQGESNMGADYRESTYEKTFALYLRTYRAGFEDENLPVCQVQLPIFDSDQHWESVEGWKYFRYTQLALSQHLSKVYTAITIDCGDKENIHPVDKQPVGERLTLLALEHVYGKDVQGDAPVYRSHTVSGETVTVTLDNVDTGLTVKGEAITNIRVRDSAGTWENANCRIGDDGKTLIFSAEGVSSPTGISYCDDNAPMATVFEKNGLPLAPFRVEW